MSDVSPEVLAMEQREKARWKTVAEAEKIKDYYLEFRKQMDESVAKLEADPDSEKEAQLFVILAMFSAQGFGNAVHSSLTKVKEYMEASAAAAPDPSA